MKITEDNFIWKIVTNNAKDLFNIGIFELYILHEDDSESLIENFEELNLALEQGLEIGIEVGFYNK